MIWIITGLCLVTIVTWLLMSPLIIDIDTRIPVAIINWKTIASARLWFQDNWYIRIHIFFYHKTVCLSTKPFVNKKVPSRTRKNKQTKGRAFSLKKMWNILQELHIHQWHLSIDTGNYLYNGQLFALNYLPQLYQHIEVNFRDENFLELKASCRPWRLLRALIK